MKLCFPVDFINRVRLAAVLPYGATLLEYLALLVNKSLLSFILEHTPFTYPLMCLFQKEINSTDDLYQYLSLTFQPYERCM